MQFFFTFVVKNSEMGRYKKNLAPNGKPSNLSDIQYKLVRTPEFKAWFGDWENDPENSSKVVDENGEPLVVYHGTWKEIKIFEKQENLSNPYLLGGDSSIGFFFTQDKERALSYAKRQSKDIILIQSFLNLRNPYYFTSITYHSIANNFKKGDLLKEQLQEIGYSDGFIIDDFYTICVYESNQIKLADGTNTTFNPNDPSIDDSQTKKGIQVEQEHKETLEKVASGEISIDEAIKETAVEHIEENPNYYDELEKIEKKPYEMTFDEFKTTANINSYDYREILKYDTNEKATITSSKRFIHKFLIKKAIQDNIEVPKYVINEYPDLKELQNNTKTHQYSNVEQPKPEPRVQTSFRNVKDGDYVEVMMGGTSMGKGIVSKNYSKNYITLNNDDSQKYGYLYAYYVLEQPKPDNKKEKALARIRVRRRILELKNR